MRRVSRPRSERGAAAVEFALILPVLLLVLGGIIDFGRFMFTQITLANASREGVRALVSNDAASAAARAQAASPSTPMTVTTTACSGPGSNATVKTTRSFQWFLVGPAVAAAGGTITLPATVSSTAVARCQ